MQCTILYVTAPDMQQAQAIGRALVEERLIACANILDSMVSVYRWEEEVRQETEVVLLLKTRAELVQAVIDRVRQLHIYDCPSIVTLPIETGNPDYLAWIVRETGDTA